MERTDDEAPEQETSPAKANRRQRGLVAKLVVLTGLFGGLASAMLFSPPVALVEAAGLTTQFPAQVNEWAGEEMFFCQDKSCGRAHVASEVKAEALDVCPTCEKGALDSGAYAERRQLPEDTFIHKTRYQHPDGQMMQAAVVLSGAHRSSIHRPEVCLEGGNTSVVGQRQLTVPLAGGQALPVKLLRLAQPVHVGGGQTVIQESWYAYFFAGNGRVTASHYDRMWMMAKDRVLANRTYRWAYVAISGVVEEGKDEQTLIADFVAALYPQLEIGPVDD